MGRPTKITQDLIKEFGDLVLKDLPFYLCCDYVGIDYQTYLAWMKQGEEDWNNDIDSEFAEFFHTNKRNYARCVAESIAIIKQGEKGWTGQAWMRERRDECFKLNTENTEKREQIVVNASMRKNNN